MNPKISIIVPVYKAEKYIEKCINSILNQSFNNYELLLIDDGSPDNSGKICDEYAKKDSRIKVFHKKNEGVSSARQLGINQAKGEYSIHVDADDWIEAGMLNDMYNFASQTNADIVFVDYYHNNRQYVSQNISNLNRYEILNAIISGELMGVLWNKLIKTQLYSIYNIRFPKGINYCEDVWVVTQLLCNSATISYLNKAYYHYMDNNQSITRNITYDIIQQRIQYVKDIKNLLLSYNLSFSLLRYKIGIKHSMLKCKSISYNTYSQTYPEIKYKLFSIPLKYTFRISLMISFMGKAGWYIAKLLTNKKFKI